MEFTKVELKEMIREAINEALKENKKSNIHEAFGIGFEIKPDGGATVEHIITAKKEAEEDCDSGLDKRYKEYKAQLRKPFNKRKWAEDDAFDRYAMNDCVEAYVDEFERLSKIKKDDEKFENKAENFNAIAEGEGVNISSRNKITYYNTNTILKNGVEIDRTYFDSDIDWILNNVSNVWASVPPRFRTKFEMKYPDKAFSPSSDDTWDIGFSISFKKADIDNCPFNNGETINGIERRAYLDGSNHLNDTKLIGYLIKRYPEKINFKSA